MDSTATTTEALPRLYSAAEIERACRLRHGTVSYLARLGLLVPAPVPGAHARYTAEAVRAALAAQPERDPRGRRAQGGDWL